MKVFVTGATGWIGQGVVQELFKAGHQVLGLARNEKNVEQLKAAGVEIHHGSLTDLESLKRGAAAADGVIHLAFDHDFSRYHENAKGEKDTIEAMLQVLEGTNKPFIATSGTLLATGDPATEDVKPDMSNPIAALRGGTEVMTLSYASKGVRTSVVRLAPTNHGEGDKGFIPMLVNTAREKGESAYIGDGSNVWPATHRLDAGKVYQLALEKGSAGSVYHATAEQSVSTKDIAAAIGKHLNVPVVSKTMEEAQAHWGFMALPMSINNPVSSKKTREELGWAPVHPTLMADLESGCYFK